MPSLVLISYCYTNILVYLSLPRVMILCFIKLYTQRSITVQRASNKDLSVFSCLCMGIYIVAPPKLRNPGRKEHGKILMARVSECLVKQ